MNMKEIIWYIGSVLVLAVVSLSAVFEWIDYKVEQDFGFYRDRGLALFKISESQLQLLNEYKFWKSVYDIYYDAWTCANSKENKLKMGTESLDYGEILLSIGVAILSKEEDQK